MKLNSKCHTEETAAYFNDIKGKTPLTKEIETELAMGIENGSIDSRNRLVEANLKFVVSIAKGYRQSGVPFQELISAGNMGLIRAADKFDYRKGVKFISYAVWWIRNMITECIEKYDNPDNEEYSFEENVDDETCEDGACKLFDEADDEFEEKLSRKQSVGCAVDDLFSVLKEREIRILSLYFGLYGNDELTLDEIGRKMNLTMERVRQIRDKAMTKVKCAALMSPEFETYRNLK